jgi:hypothetical protein
MEAAVFFFLNAEKRLQQCTASHPRKWNYLSVNFLRSLFHIADYVNLSNTYAIPYVQLKLWYLVPVFLRMKLLVQSKKKYKSPVSDQIPVGRFGAGSESFLSAIHKPTNSIWKAEELPDQCNKSIIVPIHSKSDTTVCNNYREISLL